MTSKVVLVAGFSAAVASVAFGEPDVYQLCDVALKKGDYSQVQVLADALQRLGTHPAKQVRLAEACVTAAEGRSMRYDPRSGRFGPAVEFEARLVEEEAKKLVLDQKAEESRRRNQLLNASEQANETLIAEDIYTSCRELYSQNRVEAMTNEICLVNFRQFGHPRLKEKMSDMIPPMKLGD